MKFKQPPGFPQLGPEVLWLLAAQSCFPHCISLDGFCSCESPILILPSASKTRWSHLRELYGRLVGSRRGLQWVTGSSSCCRCMPYKASPVLLACFHGWRVSSPAWCSLRSSKRVMETIFPPFLSWGPKWQSTVNAFQDGLMPYCSQIPFQKGGFGFMIIEPTLYEKTHVGAGDVAQLVVFA